MAFSKQDIEVLRAMDKFFEVIKDLYNQCACGHKNGIFNNVCSKCSKELNPLKFDIILKPDDSTTKTE